VGGSQVTGVYRIPLSQRRFKSGALYVSGIHSCGELEAIDIRYFVEEESRLIPTRQGFRIHADNLLTFKKALAKRAIKLQKVELWRGATRKLIARYCDDEYGTGVDIRYFAASPRYKGWEPRGIRLHLEDFAKLRMTLLESGIVDGRISVKTDLFSGKEVVNRRSTTRSSWKKSGSKTQRSSENVESFTINEALRAYIDDH